MSIYCECVAFLRHQLTACKARGAAEHARDPCQAVFKVCIPVKADHVSGRLKVLKGEKGNRK